MRRADRLFRIVEHLKSHKRVVTANELAAYFEVSQRTIYRDIADLLNSGVPIMGEAGIGYMLDKEHILRPMIFSLEELEAMILGAQMVRSWGDSELAKSAQSAIAKIGSVLPSSLSHEITDSFLFSFPSRDRKPTGNLLTQCRLAIRRKNKVKFIYSKEDGVKEQRIVRPLCLVLFAPAWLLLAWCETRNDFRNFRLDRMMDFHETTERFTAETGKRLKDYLEIEGLSDKAWI